jgi:hypothetical protein
VKSILILLIFAFHINFQSKKFYYPTFYDPNIIYYTDLIPLTPIENKLKSVLKEKEDQEKEYYYDKNIIYVDVIKTSKKKSIKQQRLDFKSVSKLLGKIN